VPTLSLRELNRALLGRQLLLERADLSAADALEWLVGIQAQEPQAPYVALCSRLEPFSPDELSNLIANRDAVRGTLMRSTLHLVTSRDWHRLRPLIEPVLRRSFTGSTFNKAIAGVDLRALLERARKLLAEGPSTRAELARALGADWPGIDSTALAYAVTYLEPLVQVPPRGLWRQKGQARWSLAATWLAERGAGDLSLNDLVRRYLRAFGPATVQDVQAWSGLTGLRQIVEREEFVNYRDEAGRVLLDVPDGARPDAETPAPVRFLAPFDNAILSHADRARIITPEHRRRLSRDRLMRVFLVDGFVAGSWRLDGPALHIGPFRRLRAVDRRALEHEAERLLGLASPDRAAEVHIEANS
jgi:hypothetical protein